MFSTRFSSKWHMKVLAETGAKVDPLVAIPIILIVVFAIKYKVALLCCKLKQNLQDWGRHRWWIREDLDFVKTDLYWGSSSKTFVNIDFMSKSLEYIFSLSWWYILAQSEKLKLRILVSEVLCGDVLQYIYNVWRQIDYGYACSQRK